MTANPEDEAMDCKQVSLIVDVTYRYNTWT